MTRKQRRLTIIGICGVVLAVAVLLITNAMRDSLVFFHAPTAVKEKAIKARRGSAWAVWSRTARWCGAPVSGSNSPSPTRPTPCASSTTG